MTSVSVIIPVHNVEDYLDACVQSILAQSHRDLEVFLVDDGSTDRSGLLCREWERRDARVTVLEQANQGSSVARNLGLDQATADFVTFVDSDDIVAPDYIERLVSLVTRSGADVAVTDLVKFDEGEPRFSRSEVTQFGTADEVLEYLVCVRPRWGAPGKLYRRDLFVRGPRFPVGLLHQDLHLFPRIFARAQVAIVSNDRLYAYRQRAGSVMQNTQHKRISLDILTVHSENIEFARQQFGGESDRFHRFLTAYLLQVCQYVERLPLGVVWRRNGTFLRGYRGFLKSYWPEFRRHGRVGVPYKILLGLSSISPLSFRILMGWAMWLKRNLIPGLRRGDEPR